MRPIYLDYNSTTPVDLAVFEAMKPYFTEKFGNASSTTHPYGWVAKEAVDQAREQIATALNCEEQQLLFTSGSTEAINLAIKGVFDLYSSAKGKHIVTCQTEHKAILDVCGFLEKKQGATITYLPVNSTGEIDLDQLDESITDQTSLVCLMHANNETGLIHPMKAISEIVHRNNSILMSDCTQSVGKIPLDVEELGIDICCISAHKFYGPKGIGALFYRRRNPRVALQAQIHGGGHQRNLRSGTLNTPAIVGLGKAIEMATNEQANYYKQTKALRDFLEQELRKITSLTILSEEGNRLPNTSNILFQGIDNHRLIQITNGALAVSTGSACTSATLKTSHVLEAMQLNDKYSIRFSLGKDTTKEEIELAVGILKERILTLSDSSQ